MTAKMGATDRQDSLRLVWVSASMALSSVIYFFSPAMMDPPDVSYGIMEGRAFQTLRETALGRAGLLSEPEKRKSRDRSTESFGS